MPRRQETPSPGHLVRPRPPEGTGCNSSRQLRLAPPSGNFVGAAVSKLVRARAPHKSNLTNRGASMQKAAHGSVDSHAPSTKNGLGRCLVDGDATQASNERRRRSKAFGLSILLETAALALLVLAPLLTGVAKPIFKQSVLTPIPFGRFHTTTAPRNHNNLTHHLEIPRNTSLVFRSPGYVPARPPQDEPEDVIVISNGRTDLDGPGFNPPAFVES